MNNTQCFTTTLHTFDCCRVETLPPVSNLKQPSFYNCTKTCLSSDAIDLYRDDVCTRVNDYFISDISNNLDRMLNDVNYYQTVKNCLSERVARALDYQLEYAKFNKEWDLKLEKEKLEWIPEPAWTIVDYTLLGFSWVGDYVRYVTLGKYCSLADKKTCVKYMLTGPEKIIAVGKAWLGSNHILESIATIGIDAIKDFVNMKNPLHVPQIVEWVKEKVC